MLSSSNALAASTLPSAYSGPDTLSGTSLQGSLRTTRDKSPGAEEQSKPGSSRDLGQIRRLRLLSDAREAKVLAVLDEAMSWLIVPFPSDGEESGKDAKEPVPVAPAALPSGDSSPSLAAGAVAPPKPLTSPSQTVSLTSELEHASGNLAEAGTTLKEASSESAATESPVKQLAHSESEPELAEGKAESVPQLNGSSAPAPASGAPSESADQESPASEKISSSIVSAEPDPLLTAAMELGDLDLLDCEKAWEELDADDELFSDQYYWPLLPTLVAASPSLAPSNASAASRKVSAAAAPGPAAPSGSVATGEPLASDPPKRKRGRPKGSGKKNKLQKTEEAAGLPAARSLKKGASENGTQPDLSVGVLYDANSPNSIWSSSSTEGFPHSAKMLEESSMGAGASLPTLTSPSTPNSGASSMLRSSSSVSTATAGAAALVAKVWDDGARLSPGRTSARSGRTAGTQARRLLFAGGLEASEEAKPKVETKKPSKGKTGRPRGRPRKIRPPDHAVPEQVV